MSERITAEFTDVELMTLVRAMGKLLRERPDENHGPLTKKLEKLFIQTEIGKQHKKFFKDLGED